MTTSAKYACFSSMYTPVCLLAVLPATACSLRSPFSFLQPFLFVQAVLPGVLLNHLYCQLGLCLRFWKMALSRPLPRDSLYGCFRTAGALLATLNSAAVLRTTVTYKPMTGKASSMVQCFSVRRLHQAQLLVTLRSTSQYMGLHVASLFRVKCTVVDCCAVHECGERAGLRDQAEFPTLR